MKSLKRSAVIFTISIAGLLAIRAADKKDIPLSGQQFTLEALAWQSPVRATGKSENNLHQETLRLSPTRECILLGASRCTRQKLTPSIH